MLGVDLTDEVGRARQPSGKIWVNGFRSSSTGEIRASEALQYFLFCISGYRVSASHVSALCGPLSSRERKKEEDDQIVHIVAF